MTLPNWLSLVKGSLDETPGEVTMLLHEPIGYNKASDSGISSRMFGESLAGIHKNKTINLDINTLGGKVDDGLAMANMVSARGNVTTRVTGYAASMGAIIHQAGAKRVMLPGTMLVIHNPQAELGEGDYRDADQKGLFLRKVRDSLAGMLSKRSGQKVDTINDMMDKTTAMSPDDAKKLGFCDEIGEGMPAFGEMSPAAMFEFLKTIRNGAQEGHPFYGNQHTDAATESEVAFGSSSDAKAADEAAEKETDIDESYEAHGAAAAAHEKASKLHTVAASKTTGNTSETHKAFAAMHERDAKKHSSGLAELKSNLLMKLTLSALGKLVKLPDGITDELAAPQVEKSLTELMTKVTNLEAEVKAANDAKLLRVTNRVAKAVELKLVKPERKDDLIAAGVTNESTLNFLDDIVLLSQQKRRGAAPVPRTEGGEVTVESLRAELAECKDDGIRSAEISRQLRTLRGHKELFTATK